MGAVNTTYTFTPTDTITSTKMNNIIDETVMTSDAVLAGGGLEIASGKLTISANAINSSRLASNSVTSANIIDGSILNADINASAAISGTKISPNFGSQVITTSGEIRSTGINAFRAIWGDYGSFIRNDGTGTFFLLTNSGDQTGTFNSLRPITISNSTGKVTIANSLSVEQNGSILAGTSSVRPVGTGAEAKLFCEVSGTGNIPFSVIANRNDSAGSVISLGKSRGIIEGSNTVVQNNDNIGEFRFAAADGTDVQSVSASINAQIDGIPGSNDVPGRLIFSTTPDGASSPTERMRIDSSGNVGIGKTATSKLDVNGTVTATEFDGPLTGNVTGNVTGSSGSCTGNAATATIAASCSGNSNTSSSCTGNAATATVLQTPRTIGGVSFNGGANINLPGVNIAGNQNTTGNAATATTSSSCSGNAATATLLQTSRTIAISGDITGTATSFNGGANITIPVTIDNDSVTTSKILNGNVTNAKLSSDSVTEVKIQNSSVTTNKIADGSVTAPKLNGAQSGSAPIFGVRAWVNFDASRDSSGAANSSNTNRFIRSSGNIASVLKTATGKFTVTFTTGMPDADYVVTSNSGTSPGSPRFSCADRSTATVNTVKIETDNASGAAADFNENNVMVIR